MRAAKLHHAMGHDPAGLYPFGGLVYKQIGFQVTVEPAPARADLKLRGGLQMIKPLAVALLLACCATLAAQDASAASQPSPAPAVAITFDDLPIADGVSDPATAAEAKEINRTILNALAARRIPATGFVIQKHVDELGDAGLAILRSWVTRGFDLADHLYSHADVNTLTVGQAEQEIVRGEPAIAEILAEVGRRPRYIRFPYNHTGETGDKHDELARFMALRGYKLAPCTIDNDDYEFATAYRIALRRGDQRSAAKIRAAYVAFTATAIDWYSQVASDVFGRQPPHVMLLHDSPLNRDTINEVMALFAKRGYRFVTLDEALQDPAYEIPELITAYGPMWGYRWARQLHVKLDVRKEPTPPQWMTAYAKGGPLR
jgi:peptidoglycan/xylan/chitin deacetylase (PgdA/CDA1 family)